MMRSMLSMVQPGEEQGPLAALFSDEIGRHDPAAIMEARAAVAGFDARPWITQLGGPTAVVVTTRDSLVPPDHQFHLARVTGAAVFTVEADHLAATRQAHLFVPVLLEACASVVHRIDLRQSFSA
jgi:pimeloyl-ACP methyl ester carboxylesterase